MTQPDWEEAKSHDPKDIFRVAVIGQISEDVERFFQRLTRSELKLVGKSLSETVRRDGRSVTFWALQPEGGHSIEDLLSPFGDTFHMVIVTFNSSAVKSSLELLQSVLAFDYIAKKPFAVVKFGHCQSGMYDVMKKRGIQRPQRVVFSARNNYEIPIRWIEENLHHNSRESETIDWSRATWSNFNQNLNLNQNLGQLNQLPLTANYYKGKMVHWIKTKCMDIGLMKRPINVMLLPRGGGRTTFLYRLKMGEVVTTIPTIGVNVEEGRNLSQLCCTNCKIRYVFVTD